MADNYHHVLTGWDYILKHQYFQLPKTPFIGVLISCETVARNYKKGKQSSEVKSKILIWSKRIYKLSEIILMLNDEITMQ